MIIIHIIIQHSCHSRNTKKVKQLPEYFTTFQFDPPQFHEWLVIYGSIDGMTWNNHNMLWISVDREGIDVQ